MVDLQERISFYGSLLTKILTLTYSYFMTTFKNSFSLSPMDKVLFRGGIMKKRDVFDFKLDEYEQELSDAMDQPLSKKKFKGSDNINFQPFQIQHIPLWEQWIQLPHVKDVWFIEGYESADYIYQKITGNGYDYPL